MHARLHAVVRHLIHCRHGCRKPVVEAIVDFNCAGHSSLNVVDVSA